jgi:hypothetical protein
MAINDNLENDSLLAGADKRYDTAAQDYQSGLNALPTYESPAYRAPQEDLQANIKDGGSYVTPQSLVSDQLNRFLASDSALMRQAEGDAKRKANSMGLLSSSMAIGAAQGEMMRQALPVAQADAQTYGNAMLQQQQAQNQIGQTQAEAVVTGALKQQTAETDALRDRNAATVDGLSTVLQTKLGDTANTSSQLRQSQIDMARFDAGVQADKEMFEAGKKADMEMFEAGKQADIEMFNATTLADMAKFDAGVKADMDKFNLSVKSEMDRLLLSIDADKQTSVIQGAADLVKNNQISMEQLLKDPDFMQLEPEAIRNTLNNLVQQTIGGIRFIGASSSIDMTPFLNTLAADLSWSLA